MLDNGHTPEEMLDQVLEGLDVEITDTLPTKFDCNCSKERIEKAIISVGKKEIQEMINDGERHRSKMSFLQYRIYIFCRRIGRTFEKKQIKGKIHIEKRAGTGERVIYQSDSNNAGYPGSRCAI